MKLWPLGWFRRRRKARRARYWIVVEEIYTETRSQLQTVGQQEWHGRLIPVRRELPMHTSTRRQLLFGTVRQAANLQDLNGPLRIGNFEISISRQALDDPPRAAWWTYLLPVWALP